jgi:protein-tyrosine-phosphatase
VNVLFVCTGNTCRSPLAEALMRHLLRERKVEGVTVASAGTGAWLGAPASEGSYLVALEDGVDLSAHRAQPLTPELAAKADLILTMSRSHRQRLSDLGYGDRTFLLGEYAGRSGTAAEVDDPYGGSLSDYRDTYTQLKTLLGSVVQRLERERIP